MLLYIDCMPELVKLLVILHIWALPAAAAAAAQIVVNCRLPHSNTVISSQDTTMADEQKVVFKHLIKRVALDKETVRIIFLANIDANQITHATNWF